MKKIFSILSAGLLALAAVSCVTEKPATLDLSKATAPQVLSANVNEGDIVIDFTPAVLGQSFTAPVYHWLVLSKADSKEVGAALTTSVKDNTISVSKNNAKKALAELGYSDGETVALELILRASLQDPTKDNGINGFIDAANPITINYEILASGGSADPYAGWEESTWGVTGAIASLGINWDSDIEMVTDGTWHVAKNVVLSAGDQFKFRKDHGWDTNFGAGPDITEEPYVVTLGEEQPAGPGGKNLAVPADGTYDLLVNPDASVYKVVLSGGNADPYDGWDESEWGVTGAISAAGLNWDNDIEMVTDGTWHVAKSVVLSAGDQFKFRKDHGWDTNFGAGPDITEEPYVVTLGEEQPAGPGGKNLAVPADGTYDLLLNPDEAVYKVIASGGSSSGGNTPPPPAKPTAWSLIGTLNGTSWDTDFDLDKVSGDIWRIRQVSLTESDEFKIRADHAWSKSVGGPEENEVSIIDDSNPYGVYKPEIGVAFAAGDKNIRVGVAGEYDITFDYAAQTILVEEYVEFADYIYAIGADTGWTSTYPLHTVLDNGNNTANYKGFGYLSSEFKFRPNENDWTGDWEFDGEGKIADNGGSNCPAPDEAGYYMIEVNLKEMTYTLTLITTIGVVGPAQAGGWDADTDLEYNAESKAWEGTIELSAGEMKFRANDDWGINWGGSFDSLYQGGPNITVAAGTYAIKLYAWCDGKAYAELTAQ
ncbi:MAG: hypothetical protein IK031_05300 [Bacteroidales bacterium]|nr:hypothetical protein [Bacteroidales bacterium]